MDHTFLITLRGSIYERKNDYPLPIREGDKIPGTEWPVGAVMREGESVIASKVLTDKQTPATLQKKLRSAGFQLVTR